jgi:hypothetical protein
MLNGRHDEASRHLSAPYILPRGILMAGKHTIKESQNLNSVVPFTKLKSWQIYIHFLNCCFFQIFLTIELSLNTVNKCSDPVLKIYNNYSFIHTSSVIVSNGVL